MDKPEALSSSPFIANTRVSMPTRAQLMADNGDPSTAISRIVVKAGTSVVSTLPACRRFPDRKYC